jgi:peptidyl-prolyl cis-trans isomerase SurA
MKLKGFLLGVFGLFLSFAAFSQEEAKPSLLDKIIAKIDNHYILKSEIEAQYQQYLASGQANSPDRCQILESLVVNKLMLAKAEIDSVIVEDKRIVVQNRTRLRWRCGTASGRRRQSRAR